MKLIELDQKHFRIPKNDYVCVITMPSRDFARIVRDLAQFGVSIVIACTKEGVKFSAISASSDDGDVGSANFKLPRNSGADSDKKIVIDLQEPITLTFSISYLNSFAKAAGLPDKVTLSLSPAGYAHLVVEFKVASQEKDYGYIRYYLAPKIED